MFTIQSFTGSGGEEHVVVYKGDIVGQARVPVRVHSECLTGEVFQSLRCDCREQLEAALSYFESEGRGLLIYLRHQEGRGIGIFNKIRAYALQDTGLDTVEANQHLGLPSDSRTYEAAVAILRKLQIESICLLTNNPVKIRALEERGIKLDCRVPIRIEPTKHNGTYLKTKIHKMDHMP
jgi:GTP cyclohydrolase II